MLADIGLGFIVSVFISDYFNFSLDPGFVIWCVVFALLPDLDFWFYKVFKSKLGKGLHDHRDVAHYPIVFVILAACIYFVFGYVWAISFFILTMWHFLHDSIGIGWGIKWLWPLSKNTYKFLSKENNELGFQFFSRSPSKLEEAISKYHNPNWFKTYYCHLTVISVSEAVIFIVGLVFIVLSFN